MPRSPAARRLRTPPHSSPREPRPAPETRAGRGRGPPRARARAASACGRWPADARRRAAAGWPGHTRSVRARAQPAPRSPVAPSRRARRRTRSRTAPAARRRPARDRRARSPAGGSRITHHGSRAISRAAAATQHESVRREPDERRGQHRVGRLLVARVGQRAQIRDQVDDLGMGPVAATADHVGRNPELLERPLVGPQVRRRAREHDDVARRGAGVDQLLHPGRPAPAPRPAATAPRARPAVPTPHPSRRSAARPSGHRRAGPSRPARNGVKRSPNTLREGGVERVEDLATASGSSIVSVACAPLRRELLPPAFEQRHVGMAEAVDRLERVADREQVRARNRLDQLELHAGSCPGARRP